MWVDGAAKLGDIGLVTADGATKLAGTPGFLPPEVLAGTREYEPEDDFYALGKVVYCALTGNPVEEYPSFPDSRTLGDCGDLILLYNRLCSGKAAGEGGGAGRGSRNPAVRFLAPILLVCVGAAAWFILHTRTAGLSSASPGRGSVPRMTTPPAAPESASAPTEPSPSAVPGKTSAPQAKTGVSAKHFEYFELNAGQERLRIFLESQPGYGAEYLGTAEMPEVAAAKKAPASDARAAQVCEVGALLEEYAVSPEFMKILPLVIDELHRVTPDSGRMAGRRFTDAHRDAPEKRFHDAAVMVRVYADGALEGAGENDDLIFRGTLRSLREALVRRKKLETALLRKYKNKGAAAAKP